MTQGARWSNQGDGYVLAQTNAALARQFYQLFNENKFDEALALATEDVEVVLIPFGQTFHGREGFREVMQGCKRAFPNFQVSEITHQVATADAVVNEFKAHGAHTGVLITTSGQTPPTGLTVEFTICEVWQVRAGKLALLRHYQDVASIQRQLGLAP
jgi:steroid delta-isomerase-like uncharacterized protein